jgi:diadenosine tetraphosphate (Ap4A) HIT family hydrolase
VDLKLCAARLQLDARFPWIVLIPRRTGARELEDLSREDLAALTDDVLTAGRAVRAIGRAQDKPVEKLNVGALGNIVPQLHLHVVGRRADDDAWPGPVWGAGVARPYADADLERVIGAAKGALGVAEG